MTRGKVKLAYITNDTSRKTTFRKRKKGLMKKASELSTLCGVETCAIIYNQNNEQPEVWPNTLETHCVLSKFESFPEMEKTRNMMNQEGSIRKRIDKTTKHLEKQLGENKEKEMTEVMYQCMNGEREVQHLMLPEVNYLRGKVDRKLEEINREIKKRESLNEQVAVPPAVVAASGGGNKGKGVMQVEEPRPMFDYGRLHANAMQGQQSSSQRMSMDPNDDCGIDALWSSLFFGL